MSARHGERALSALEQRFGPRAPEVIAALEALGRAYVDEQRPAKALDVYLRLLAAREAALGPDAPDLADLLRRVGTLHQWRNGHRQARPYLERALALKQRLVPVDDPSLGELLMELGTAYGCGAPRRLANAEMHYRHALTVLERAHGAQHWQVSRAIELLADLLHVQGRIPEAEAMFARGLELCRAYPMPPDEAKGWLLAFVRRYALHLPGGTAERAWWERRTIELWTGDAAQFPARWAEVLERSA